MRDNLTISRFVRFTCCNLVCLLLVFFTLQSLASRVSDSIPIQDLVNLTDNQKLDTLIILSEKFLTDDPFKAKFFASEAIKYLQPGTDSIKMVRVHFLMGESEFFLGNFDSALVAYEKSLQVEQFMRNPSGLSDILGSMGMVYAGKNDHENAANYYLKAIDLENQLNRKEVLSKWHNQLGRVYQSLSDFQHAIEHFNQALLLEEQLNNKQRIADIINNIGVVYFDLGDYEKALEHYSRSLKLVEEIDNKQGIAVSLNNIGIVYYDWGKKEKALEYYQKSLKIEEELGNKKGIADSYNNIGITYSDWDQNTIAIDYYQKSLAIYREFNDFYGTSRSLNNIGESYLASGNHDKALSYLLESLEIEKKLKNKLGISQSYNAIANVYFKLGDDNQALRYNNLSFELADSCRFVSVLLLNYELFYKIYNEKQSYQQALAYYQLYANQKDSIYNQQFHDNVAELETKYEIDRIQKEREVLISEFLNQGKEIRDNERDSKQQRVYLIIIFILMVIFGILVYYDIKSKINANRKLKKINSEITEQKEKLSEAHEELSKSEAKYKNLISYSPTGILYIDKKGNILEVNKKMLEILGSPDEQATKAINCLEFPPLQKVGLAEEVARCLATGEVICNENWYTSKWGKKLFLRYYVTPVKTRKGAVTNLIINVEDITLSKEIELSKKQSDRKYEMLVEHSLQAMLIIQSGKMIFANHRVEDLTQYGFNEIKEKGKDWIKLLIHPDDLNRARKSIREALQGKGINPKNEFRYIRKDGHVRWIESLGSILEYNGKRALLVVAVDISSRKEAEAILIESSEKLKELNAMKDRFFSIIAHDLKNPFNTILGFSNLLFEAYNDFDESQRKTFIKNICEASENTYKLLQNLLDWSSTQTGNIDFNPAKINLASLVRGNIDLMKSIAESKRIHISFNHVNDSYVFADKNMVNTVIRNLLSNAIKFTKREGKVEITIAKLDTEVQLTIDDNGVGIEKENLQRLFRIDQHFKSLGTEKEEGSGLGLILCREFIEKNKGRIWAESRKGEGSRFIFTLPKKA